MVGLTVHAEHANHDRSGFSWCPKPFLRRSPESFARDIHSGLVEACLEQIFEKIIMGQCENRSTRSEGVAWASLINL